MENKLKGKKVLLTVGPTREYLDPVRFITNESSGKMGYALAEELQKLGAELIVVSGPVSIETSISSGNIIGVTSALEMFEACKQHFNKVDIAIFTAAVADYRPKNTSTSKIKKHTDIATVEFVKNPDIALEFGIIKKHTSYPLVLRSKPMMYWPMPKRNCIQKTLIWLSLTVPTKGKVSVTIPIKYLF